jgi:leader peptidase (prepilin peptidase)/N-methyltransferase
VIVDPLPQWMVVAFSGLLGALVGSFLNVCIGRWPAKESVVKPRSRCPSCKASIAWYDNLPVLSWIFLRAKCRHCGKGISVQYPLIEIATAGIWAYVAYQHGLSLATLQWAVFGTILLGIALTDAQEYIIPDEFSLGGLVLGLLFSLGGGLPGLVQAVLGAAVGFGVLYLIGYFGTLAFKEEAMGGGDIKMMAMVGAFLGWQGVLLTIFLGALAGSIIFVPLSLIGQRKLVPFGVFLSLGGAATYLFGEPLLTWYRGYLGV